MLRRRKSPGKGCLWDLFEALLYAPELPLLKNLTIELAVIDATEKRIDDGKGSWRRKGISIVDRQIAVWHHSVALKSLKDYQQFIPFKKTEQFTVKELAEKAGIKAALARKAIYTLTKMGLVKHIGNKGKAKVYKKQVTGNREQRTEKASLVS